MPGRSWLLHPSRARFVASPRIGYASRPNRAIDGRGLSPPRSAALLAAPHSLTVGTGPSFMSGYRVTFTVAKRLRRWSKLTRRFSIQLPTSTSVTGYRRKSATIVPDDSPKSPRRRVAALVDSLSYGLLVPQPDAAGYNGHSAGPLHEVHRIETRAVPTHPFILLTRYLLQGSTRIRFCPGSSLCFLEF